MLKSFNYYSYGYHFKNDHNSKTCFLLILAQLTAWFNNEAYHTPGISVNLLSNTLLQAYTSNKTNKISTINFPLPPNSAQKNQKNNQY